MSITNGDLLSSTTRSDHLSVVTDEPKERDGRVLVTLDLEKAAAVIDSLRPKYPQQPYSINDIRMGKDGLWLLSGGTLITDHQGRIAIGLRDGNAADPFTYTNIGAGRCNRKLLDHCMEEFYSELVVCIWDAPRGWMQLQFDESAPNLSDVRNKIAAIEKWKNEIGRLDQLVATKPIPQTGLPAMQTLVVEWAANGRVAYRETLDGYLLIDHRNHTLEVRLPIRLDLSAYARVEIFYAEGTGYAAWKTPRQILDLAHFEQTFGATLVSPFLADIAAKLA